MVPAIYHVDAIRSAQAIVSLPDYRGTPAWFKGADYLYFSTAHWRPIVNGFGRAEPADYSHVISHMNAFPGPNNANTMRRLGVEYVVLHAARLQGGGEDVERSVLSTGDTMTWSAGSVLTICSRCVRPLRPAPCAET